MKFTANNSGPHTITYASFDQGPPRQLTARVDLEKGETIDVSLIKSNGDVLRLEVVRAEHNSGSFPG